MEKFKVTGPLPVLGRVKGETVEIDSPEQAERLIAAGHVRKVKQKAASPPEAPTKPPSGPAAQSPPKQEE